MQRRDDSNKAFAEDLLQVRVSHGGASAGMEHFTPGCSMRWGNCQFFLNPPDGGSYDFWIVFGNALGTERAQVAPENTLFIAGEPPAKKIYPQPFYNQFRHVVDTHDGSRHPGLIVSALGLCWLVGLDFSARRFRFGYDHFTQLPRPEKANRISVVCSASAKTAGQRARLRFLEVIKRELGDRVVHFGKGFQPIDDKLDAILPYRFHLSLENSQSPHYWTEKVTDAYLGWAHPFYLGCPNLGDYFARESFTPLSIDEPLEAAALMAAALDGPETPGELAAVDAARRQVLDVYNPFARFDHWVRQLHRPEPKVLFTIKSYKHFTHRGRIRKFFLGSPSKHSERD